MRAVREYGEMSCGYLLLRASTATTLTLLVIASSASAAPLFLPGDQAAPGGNARMEVVPPQKARTCSLAMSGRHRGTTSYRLALGGPTRFVRWSIPRGARGTWSVRLACRDGAGRSLGATSKQLRVKRSGRARGALVRRGSLRSSRGSIPMLPGKASTRAAVPDSSGASNPVGLSSFTKCENSRWIISTKTTGVGVASLIQMEPTAEARTETRKNRKHYEQMWNDLNRCANFSNLKRDHFDQYESVFVQMECHAFYGLKESAGGNTWDLEAWRRFSGDYTLALLPTGRCGNGWGDIENAGRFFNDRLVNSSFDEKAQKEAWLVRAEGGRFVRRPVPMIATYFCLTGQGRAPAEMLPGDFLNTYLRQPFGTPVGEDLCPSAPAQGSPSATPPGGGSAPVAGSVTVGQGPAAPQGFRYAISLSGFPANRVVEIVCRDSGAPAGFFSFKLTTNVSGAASTSSQCYSADGPEHWVTANGVESNRARWSGSTPAPAPSPQPQPAPPPAPTTAALVVDNRVTNGSTAMREDTPAYLSTVTRNFCKRDGCALGGTDVGSGNGLTAECTVIGDRTTNGQDNSTIDDGNAGLYSSTRWYGIRWGDGRFGYISEVWIRGQDRGGKGLRGC